MPTSRRNSPSPLEGEGWGGGSTKTLRHPAELVAAGLVAPEREAALAAVARRYAVAVTP